MTVGEMRSRNNIEVSVGHAVLCPENACRFIFCDSFPCCSKQQKLAADASQLVHLPPGEALVSCDFGLKGESRFNLILAFGGLAGLKLCINFRWEDGEPVKSCLEAPDRWQTQAAERVTIEIAPDKLVTVQQQVVTSSAV